jgi:hypothetical protein
MGNKIVSIIGDNKNISIITAVPQFKNKKGLAIN